MPFSSLCAGRLKLIARRICCLRWASYVQAERWARRAQHRGKIKYSNVITFATKELRDRFSEAIIEAVRLAYPDVLVPTEGRSS